MWPGLCTPEQDAFVSPGPGEGTGIMFLLGLLAGKPGGKLVR